MDRDWKTPKDLAKKEEAKPNAEGNTNNQNARRPYSYIREIFRPADGSMMTSQRVIDELLAGGEGPVLVKRAQPMSKPQLPVSHGRQLVAMMQERHQQHKEILKRSTYSQMSDMLKPALKTPSGNLVQRAGQGEKPSKVSTVSSISLESHETKGEKHKSKGSLKDSRGARLGHRSSVSFSTSPIIRQFDSSGRLTPETLSPRRSILKVSAEPSASDSDVDEALEDILTKTLENSNNETWMEEWKIQRCPPHPLNGRNKRPPWFEYTKRAHSRAPEVKVPVFKHVFVSPLNKKK